MLLINSSSLAAAAFQRATGHSNQHILFGLSILPEPESRYGLSLAHNDAFATIARSMFLACTFVSTSKTFANPFDSWLFRSVRFRGRTGATSTPGTRFPLYSSTLRILSRSPLPSSRGANTMSKLVERESNIGVQFGQLLGAQLTDLVGLQENIEVDYSYWINGKLAEKRRTSR
jgi:hypothetical protein